MILGIGRNGHIGFNEPFSQRQSRTRLVMLDPVTRKSAASDFFSEEHVPTQAVTMGLATILEARQIILIAHGEQKAGIVREAVEGPPPSGCRRRCSASIPDTTFLLDDASGRQH